MAYAKAINKQESRVGSLFQKNFKRKIIHNENYFTSVVHYINANPQLHGICKDYKEHLYSSCHRILIDKPTKLQKQAILNWFGRKEVYLKFHKANLVDIKERSKYEIVDSEAF